MRNLKVSEQPQVVERIVAWIREEIDSYPDTPANYIADAVVGIKSVEGADIEEFFGDSEIFTARDLEDENGRVYEEVSFRVLDVQRIEGALWLSGAKFELNLTDYMATMLEHSRRAAERS